MYSALINEPPIPVVVAAIPALFAKSSLVWPAILNLILLNRERQKFFDSVIEEGSKLLRSLRNHGSSGHNSFNVPNQGASTQNLSKLQGGTSQVSNKSLIQKSPSQITNKTQEKTESHKNSFETLNPLATDQIENQQAKNLSAETSALKV